ncbi:thioredoxin family protein [Sulfobacillus harzensis]|uniref:Thioredoxin-like fold domain-containing protein n=1 Tax=Sulfobacillus harzensis TaxID=2729629 RepID=A0A7Y0Q2F5_9FIRM|nr:thioredoxin family protein [Sulfobacillus harzensis]NMP22442.1 hypothetical protein [Sulfobacillus harzensis]
MSVFSVRDRRMLREMLADVTRPVGVLAYAEDSQRPAVEDLMGELARLTRGPLSAQVLNDDHDGALIRAIGFQRTPSFAFVNAHGEIAPVEMVGLPTGYQFGAFLNMLLVLNRGRLNLSHAVQGALKNAGRDVRLEVVVAATCPNCPGVVRLVQQCALANPARIRAVSIDAIQHPDLAGPGVEAVPLTRIWVEGRMAGEHTGLMSEQQLYQLIQGALKGVRWRDRTIGQH